MNFTILYRAHRIFAAYQNILKPGMKILDVGCGNGVVGAFFAEKLGGRVTGTDILDYTSGRIPFRRMAHEDALPFLDGEFDIAMLNDMLHHMPYENQIKILREALRVARTVLVFEVHPTWYAKFTDYLANKIHQPLMRISFTHRTKEEWETLWQEMGIEYRYKEIGGGETLSPPQKTLGWKTSAFLYGPVLNYCFVLQKK